MGKITCLPPSWGSGGSELAVGEKCGGCGGCDMFLDYAAQVRARLEIVSAAFRKEYERKGLDAGTLPQIKTVTGDETHYRARFQLDRGAFHKYHSNSLVTVHNCPIATDEVNEYLAAQSDCMNGTNANDSERGKNGANESVVFGDKRVVPGKGGKKVVTGSRSGKSAPSEETTVCVELNTTCGKRMLQFDVRSFFQSNLGMLERAIPLVCGRMTGHNVLDMYAGCGTFSTFLADAFDMVTIVEKDKLGITFAEVNMKGAKADGARKSFALSGSRWVKFHGEETQFDAAVLDPPRNGLEREVLQYFVSHPVGEVRYLSCNAATHARDVASLAAAGYTLCGLTMLDFYPQTHHTETLATLRW